MREETGTGLRDGEEDVVELPTAWSKRGLYFRFCYERGWKVNTDGRGRTNLEAIIGKDQHPVCHWSSFLRFIETLGWLAGVAVS